MVATQLASARSDVLGVTGAAAVRLDGVSKIYGRRGASVPALDRLSLDVRRGELLCLVGASGCGKSTLLNLIAGLDAPTAGTVTRTVGEATLMFQESALFPWLTVERNVELALQLARYPKERRRERVEGLLRLVRLDGFSEKRPHELSGGMRQRVALARALAQERPVLLMDEPFGALDAITRDVLHDELERVWSETALTIVFVTHNVAEAVRLGDRVVVLTSRPGTVAATFEVGVDRPRRIDAPEVGEIAGEITHRLRREVARHGRD
ncbi:MAG TPA: ABC transporter ATP-binding protein [Acidimicrobiales bacterium]|nr:ABC transporter ATP-binding protein [Acidimicrobiales bacterium]